LPTRKLFYGTPIVAWEPVWNAHDYEIQWSKSANPWQTVGSSITPATATVVPVERGVWYYRVRGLNPSLPKKPEMTWSSPVRLRVAGPRFFALSAASRLRVNPYRPSPERSLSLG
jgi:hypothetical protein